jgi:hypothetical protein
MSYSACAPRLWLRQSFFAHAIIPCHMKKIISVSCFIVHVLTVLQAHHTRGCAHTLQCVCALWQQQMEERQPLCEHGQTRRHRICGLVMGSNHRGLRPSVMGFFALPCPSSGLFHVPNFRHRAAWAPGAHNSSGASSISSAQQRPAHKHCAYRIISAGAERYSASESVLVGLSW